MTILLSILHQQSAFHKKVVIFSFHLIYRMSHQSVYSEKKWSKMVSNLSISHQRWFRMNSTDPNLKIEKSAKSGPKKDLFKFESVNTLMGHTVHGRSLRP